MTIVRSPLTSFLAFLARRKAKRIAEREERRRAAIMRQIAYRREKRREFMPLYGDLRRATHAALAAEIKAGG